MSTPRLLSSEAAPPAAPTIRWGCSSCGSSLTARESGQESPCPVCGTPGRSPRHPGLLPPAMTSDGMSSLVPTGPSKWSRLGSLMVLAAILIGCGVTHLAFWLIERSQRADSNATASGIYGASQGATLTLELRTVLDHFLRERTWAGKRRVVLEPARLDAQAPAYYLGRDPDEIRATDFVPFSLPETRSVAGVHALRAERPGQRPVIALFKRSGDAWKLDWEMFTQTYDEILPRFVAEPDFAIRTLKARVSRSFAPAGETQAFLITLSDFLDRGQRIEIELPVATPLMQEIASGLEGTSERAATVEVCWIRPGANGDCVPAVQRLVCWGWRGVTGQPVPATPAVEAAEFALPASAPRDIPTRADAENPVAASAATPVAVAGGR